MTATGNQRTYVEVRLDTVRAYVLVKVPGELAQITVRQSIDTVLPGSSVQFTTQFSDGYGNPLAASALTWSVADPLLGTVSGTGLFTAAWPGIATVRAQSGTVVGSADTRVLVPVASVELNLDQLTLAAGSKYRAAVTVRDSAGGVITGRVVAWRATGGSTTVTAVANEVLGLQQVADVRAAGNSIVVAAVEGHADTTHLSGRGFTFTQVDAGILTSCAVDDTGAIACWGWNETGQLGTTGVFSISGPTLVPGTQHWKSVTVGWKHVCALTTTGQAWCWGNNELGQLGNATNTSSAVPVPVSGGFVFTTITAGVDFTCGLTSSGETRCWGANDLGQLGTGTSGGSIGQPSLVSGAHAFTSIAAGPADACGLAPDGTGWCWGNPSDGELGVGDHWENTIPQVISGFQFKSIAAGAFHGCALDLTGSAYCWGAEGFTGTGVGDSNTPYPVQNYPIPFVSIEGGEYHSCGINSNAEVLCWGSNNTGAAGADFLRPIVTGATSVSAGGSHSCAISAGHVYCWGSNEFGQLGVGSAVLNDAMSYTPLLVVGQN